MKQLTRLVALIGMGLFLASFFLPAIAITSELKINGFYAFLLELSMLFYVSDGAEYAEFLLMGLTNIWTLFLFIRFWRKNERKGLTFLVIGLMLVSVVYWLYKMEDTSVLLIGFWVWVTGAVLVAISNVLKIRSSD